MPKRDKEKDSTITIRISSELKERLLRSADKHNKTLSQYVSDLLERRNLNKEEVELDIKKLKQILSDDRAERDMQQSTAAYNSWRQTITNKGLRDFARTREEDLLSSLGLTRIKSEAEKAVERVFGSEEQPQQNDRKELERLRDNQSRLQFAREDGKLTDDEYLEKLTENYEKIKQWYTDHPEEKID